MLVGKSKSAINGSLEWDLADRYLEFGPKREVLKVQDDQPTPAC